MCLVFIACMPGAVIVGDSGPCCCGGLRSMCEVNCSRAITSKCVLTLQKRSRSHSVSDYDTKKINGVFLK